MLKILNEKENASSWDSKNERVLEDVTLYVKILADYNKVHINALDYLKVLSNTVTTARPNPLVVWIDNAQF